MTSVEPDKHETPRDELGKWLPGQSPNPAGRPKRKTLTELIHAKLDENPENWDKLAKLVIDQILKMKNKDILKTFWNYTDGMPKQTVTLDDPTARLDTMKQYVDAVTKSQEVQSVDTTVPQEPKK